MLPLNIDFMGWPISEWMRLRDFWEEAVGTLLPSDLMGPDSPRRVEIKVTPPFKFRFDADELGPIVHKPESADFSSFCQADGHYSSADAVESSRAEESVCETHPDGSAR